MSEVRHGPYTVGPTYAYVSTRSLTCDMTKTCADPVTHIDNKGFVYCSKHGHERRYACPCRKLQPWELQRLEHGETIPRY